jgi:hypothetical protein
LCVGENPTLLPAKKSNQIFGPTSQPTQSSVLAKTIMTHPISETNLFGISPGRFLYCTIDHIRWRRWIKVGCILLGRQREFPRRRRRGSLPGQRFAGMLSEGCYLPRRSGGFWFSYGGGCEDGSF